MGQGTGKVIKSPEDASDSTYPVTPPLSNVYAPYGSPVEGRVTSDSHNFKF